MGQGSDHWIGPDGEANLTEVTVVAANGASLLPGLIDAHVHICLDPTIEGVDAVVRGFDGDAPHPIHRQCLPTPRRWHRRRQGPGFPRRSGHPGGRRPSARARSSAPGSRRRAGHHPHRRARLDARRRSRRPRCSAGRCGDRGGARCRGHQTLPHRGRPRLGKPRLRCGHDGRGVGWPRPTRRIASACW